MHLLAAKPGGFVDEEGIIDLNQDSADIVVLSAADSTLAALSEGLRALHASVDGPVPNVRLANWMQLRKPAAYDLYEDKVLESARVVVVSLLGGASYWAYGLERLIDWQQAAPASRTLVVVPGDDAADPELFDACSTSREDALRVWRYLREGGADNSQQLYRFLVSTYLGLSLRWHEPRLLPRCLIYMPAGTAHPGGQATLAEWQQRWALIAPSPDATLPDSILPDRHPVSRPVVLLLFYRSQLQSANTAMFDALIRQLEQAGLAPLPMAIASLKDKESIALVNALQEQTGASLILSTLGFANNTVASPDLSAQPGYFQSPLIRPIPVLQLILSSSTEEDWQSYTQGLRSRDIAMQVVLPEMDGRIVTRAISFKAESHYDALGQIAVVRYSLHQERAQFVAELARRYCRLAVTANQNKRIALILANYPTKDGRIGNGVGLDTPASAVNILQAMKQAGYALDELPLSGNALIEALLGAVTNNPETLHQRPCWQSLSLDDYQAFFCRLPEDCQQAVLTRWGRPEDDIKCRQGRLMLAGIRLGEIFVGIQPARGFNLDLAANYHDPDLVPPHSYLAFYFWLRHVYEVDAIVHVGKHGNLEWLPGKGTALSAQCWPDIALGPMPHFYPFIVNDPGEGAQAKRRTQAVIIDHLMPPMTRAESYGALAELESLVDEYYQAMGMDDKRERWLRQAILDKVNRTHVLDELGARDSGDDEALLADLDAYLCDIKEAQIRHGLHILGRLPEAEKLADTLVALLRLPRGDTPESQGILHNLVQDLDLRCEQGWFDPLAAGTRGWSGGRPACLQTLDASVWRTEADTRERLEQFAKNLLQRYVLDTGDWHEILHLPNTQQQLRYAKNVLCAALEQSATQEISALLDGLSGQFVAPGPSGAPTRGRLDTLPTGRNFYSVDNRAIPSPAAWAIGQRAAQALIERHLQTQGEYPKQLGLSVWGTATMRTGGDDIAQAFALMGVEPLWAPGSNRVIDFKVLSTQVLGRPRVDVTLRVSGFFRDAFPNVMKLFDAAVQAIADIEEPGNENIIQQNVRARQAALEAEGHTPQAAYRQATYRVFGSKPGAYGAGLQGLIDERCWERREDLAEAYLNWGGYAYGNDAGDGVEARQAFRYQLTQLEVVAQNQDNREHDILDSDDYYQFQGGMSNAVAMYRGVEPVIYHNDLSNPMVPKVRTLKEELNRVIRSRLLNPKWITAMREHGYKGAFEMAASVDYLFAYDATTNLIDDYQYEQVTETLLMDRDNRQFLLDNNPNVLEEMAERLLEAIQRGMWQSPGDYAGALQDLLLDLDHLQESAHPPGSMS
ncbi:MAG: cobaltochelatase subunit CobN [Hahellaceae bacterium]|nr:cobaltochelatase subunit CobN [Hahellaceae bacterium]MCP5170168.1 cobaltochelatase subunit CobN [Hahellaceae bacterium]